MKITTDGKVSIRLWLKQGASFPCFLSGNGDFFLPPYECIETMSLTNETDTPVNIRIGEDGTGVAIGSRGRALLKKHVGNQA